MDAVAVVQGLEFATFKFKYFLALPRTWGYPVI